GLRIEVEHANAPTQFRQRGSEVNGRCRLPHAALLVDNSDPSHGFSHILVHSVSLAFGRHYKQSTASGKSQQDSNGAGAYSAWWDSRTGERCCVSAGSTRGAYATPLANARNLWPVCLRWFHLFLLPIVAE